MELKDVLKNLYINHVFGMAGVKYFQPDISLLKEEDIINASKFVDDITTKINWGDALEENEENKKYITIVNQLKEEDVEKYFDEIYKHFNMHR